jgi:hypothetical protein
MRRMGTIRGTTRETNCPVSNVDLADAFHACESKGRIVLTCVEYPAQIHRQLPLVLVNTEA